MWVPPPPSLSPPPASDFGSPLEVEKNGMLRASFGEDGKLDELEMMFDGIAVHQQLQRAIGGKEGREKGGMSLFPHLRGTEHCRWSKRWACEAREVCRAEAGLKAHPPRQNNCPTLPSVLPSFGVVVGVYRHEPAPLHALEAVGPRDPPASDTETLPHSLPRPPNARARVNTLPRVNVSRQ